MPVNITLPTPDWSTIIPSIVPLFFNALGTYLMQQAQMLLDALSGDGINILTHTPPEWTYQLGPLHDFAASGLDATYGVISLALVLAGFALLGRQFFGWSWTLGEHAARIALAVIFASGFFRLAQWSIDLVNAVDAAIGAAPIPSPNTGTEVNPLVMAVLMLIWIVLVARLLIRMAYRLLIIDVLFIFGPIAMLTWAIPQSQWIARRWMLLWVSWLIGQPLVVACLKLGSILANPFGGSWPGMLLGIGVLLLAHDVVDLIGGRNVVQGAGLAPALATIRGGAGAFTGMVSGGASVVAAKATAAVAAGAVARE